MSPQQFLLCAGLISAALLVYAYYRGSSVLFEKKWQMLLALIIWSALSVASLVIFFYFTHTNTYLTDYVFAYVLYTAMNLYLVYLAHKDYTLGDPLGGIIYLLWPAYLVLALGVGYYVPSIIRLLFSFL